MLFSIITVCFNSAKTIRQTFDSVLQQEFPDYEYIVVDGASTDGTVDIIKEYEPKFQGRMRWISEPDSGIYDAMNKALRMSKGDYLLFIGSDDLVENNALRKVADFISQYPGKTIYYGIVRHISKSGIEGNVMRPSHLRLNHANPMAHQGIFTKREMLCALGGFRTKYNVLADCDSCMRIFEMDPEGFQSMDFIVSSFRDGGISSTFQCQLNQLELLHDHKKLTDRQYYKILLKFKIKYFLLKLQGRS